MKKEINKLQKGIDNLLDAYGENLITLAELRKRIPGLRKREEARQKELINLELQEENRTRFVELSHNIKQFLEQIRISAKTLDIQEKQKILRMLVKEIIVGKDKIIIHHSIPLNEEKKTKNVKSYLLCTRSH